MTFEISDGTLRSRIDRTYVYDDWKLVSTSTATSTQVTSVRLPHRLQTVYNSVSVLEDIAVESIILNEVL